MIYDSIFKASGHGKVMVDSQNSMDKNLRGMYLKYLVVHPKEILEGFRKVLTYKRDENGFLVSLAQVCYEIVNDPEQTQGAKSDSDMSRHRKIFEIQ